MKARLLGAVVLALLLILVFAVVAQAAVPQSVIDAIIADAQDGRIDGTWTAAEVQAALDYIANNPVYEQYSDLKGVLTDYLASLQAPGSQEGAQLAFTGGEVMLILGAGLGLIGTGAALRRRKS
jgi:glucose dehydrogenase